MDLFVFVYFLNQLQRLRPLGYYAPLYSISSLALNPDPYNLGHSWLHRTDGRPEWEQLSWNCHKVENGSAGDEKESVDEKRKKGLVRANGDQWS